MPPAPETHPTPRADLELALEGGLELVGRLLTRGEAWILRTWLALPIGSRALYARLLGRRDRMVPIHGLGASYAEVDEPDSALHALLLAGFVWQNPVHSVPISWRLPLYDRSELATHCRNLGLDHRGRRGDLEARLMDGGASVLRALQRPGVRLRHRKLFRRVCSVFLGRSDGDLRALVLQRMGTVRFASYTATGGTGPFPNRQVLIELEQARSLARRVARTGTLDASELQLALGWLADAPTTPPDFRRFRASRYGAVIAEAAATSLEKSHAHAAAIPIWEALVASAGHGSTPAARRLALCHAKNGRPDLGAEVCTRAQRQSRGAARLALERTGRRLARKAKRPWRPSPPLLAPFVRSLSLEPTERSGSRPRWSGELVETATANFIRMHGRAVVEGENVLWTTLFGVLLRDVIFAPVPEMLPGRLQMAPLDLGLPAFAARRRRALDKALTEIRCDGGMQRLLHAFRNHHGEAIRGVAWNRWSAEQLGAILDGLGGDLIASVLSRIAEGASRTGLPDLWILRGDAVRMPGLFPANLRANPIAVEVKGPGDTLRDNQHVWHHDLQKLGIPTEVWEIRPAP